MCFPMYVHDDDLVAPDELEPGIFVRGDQVAEALQRYQSSSAIAEDLNEQMLGMLEQGQAAEARNRREEASFYYREALAAKERCDEQLRIVFEAQAILEAAGFVTGKDL